ncbi:MAG: AAA family ATPase [Methylococcaceae bacterium]|nr:AAA family ATPase [Methylococcaceae bacterium]
MYTTYFGFKQIPFDTKLNPGEFFYGLSARTIGLALTKAIQDHCAAMFLCGDSGVGKTALIRKLAQDLNRTQRFLFPAREGSRIEPILDCLIEGLGLDFRGRAPRQKIEFLRRNLANSDKIAANRTLVIDDAHELSSATIDYLLGVVRDRAGEVPSIQLLFAGSPALKSRVSESWSSRNNGVATAWYHLEGLTDEEVRTFIDRRLELAGYRGGPLFSDRAIQRIIEYSDGNIAKVSVLCGFSLLNASLENLKVVTDKIVEEAAVHCLLNEHPATSDAAAPACRDDATLPSPAVIRDRWIGSELAARYEELGIPRPDSESGNETNPETSGCTRSGPPVRSWHTGFPLMAKYASVVLSAALLLLIIVSNAYSFNTARQAGNPNSDPAATDRTPAADSESARHIPAGLPGEQNEAPGNSADSKIQAMLFKAQGQIAAQRLFAPAGDNALDTYKEIGRLVERQLQTLNDMVRIKQLYQRWGLEAEIQGDWVSAERFYRKAFKLSPQDEELTMAIERVRNQPAGTDSSSLETKRRDLQRTGKHGSDSEA